MRTSNKVFREQVRRTIKESLCTDYTEDLKEQLEHVSQEFHSWYGPYEQRQYPNKQEAFKAYALCLPSCLDFEYTYEGYHVVLKGWFEDAGAEYRDQKEEREQDLYYSLMYRELNKLMEMEGVEF